MAHRRSDRTGCACWHSRTRSAAFGGNQRASSAGALPSAEDEEDGDDGVSAGNCGCSADVSYLMRRALGARPTCSETLLIMLRATCPRRLCDADGSLVNTASVRSTPSAKAQGGRPCGRRSKGRQSDTGTHSVKRNATFPYQTSAAGKHRNAV